MTSRRPVVVSRSDDSSLVMFAIKMIITEHAQRRLKLPGIIISHIASFAIRFMERFHVTSRQPCCCNTKGGRIGIPTSFVNSTVF